MTTSAPILAIDLDDTVSATNTTLIQWHNDIHGTALTLDDLYYYHYWKTPGWGNPEEAMKKARTFFGSRHFLERKPVPGAVEALRRLKKAGYKLVIVTSRGDDLKAETEAWIAKYCPDVFEDIHYTGEFLRMKTDENGNVVRVFKSKAEVLMEIGAVVLIDDCVDHTLHCATFEPAIPSLLFGEYPWGKRQSPLVTQEDYWSYQKRVEKGVHDQWMERDRIIALPDCITPTRNWDEVEKVVKELVPIAVAAN
ncbi:hypothetical protein DACRYDRAFT_22733 [Dacryopinax primogenitus]|uniref:HAD-like protein n=1 Tax=Dacryopinax primogenitus (strain DJM 731) TaxID=1858805 RepID=M5FWT1_DACPD|nr:uncharacterized protein DACRYDRAFT_22733 [Dacryopinax primogenitus]EJU00864.1 hypothetical protein DACRYDRAFT_22733 [Dacryopinax primogenitus]